MEVDPVHDVLVGRRDLQHLQSKTREEGEAHHLHSQRQHHLEQLRRLEGHMREVAVPWRGHLEATALSPHAFTASMRSENPPAIGGDGPEEKPLGDLEG
eukprot:768450-Hanusia_phi.AAC.5